MIGAIRKSMVGMGVTAAAPTSRPSHGTGGTCSASTASVRPVSTGNPSVRTTPSHGNVTEMATKGNAPNFAWTRAKQHATYELINCVYTF